MGRRNWEEEEVNSEGSEGTGSNGEGERETNVRKEL